MPAYNLSLHSCPLVFKGNVPHKIFIGELYEPGPSFFFYTLFGYSVPKVIDFPRYNTKCTVAGKTRYYAENLVLISYHKVMHCLRTAQHASAWFLCYWEGTPFLNAPTTVYRSRWGEKGGKWRAKSLNKILMCFITEIWGWPLLRVKHCGGLGILWKGSIRKIFIVRERPDVLYNKIKINTVFF